MAKKVGVLVDLDYCVGCYACQSACQDYYQLPVTETYMRVINNKPDIVDGEAQMFMAPFPYRLDKCAYCLEQEGEAPCGKICIGKALHVDEIEKLEKLANESDFRTLLYQ